MQQTNLKKLTAESGKLMKNNVKKSLAGSSLNSIQLIQAAKNKKACKTIGTKKIYRLPICGIEIIRLSVKSFALRRRTLPFCIFNGLLSRDRLSCTLRSGCIPGGSHSARDLPASGRPLHRRHRKCRLPYLPDNKTQKSD